MGKHGSTHLCQGFVVCPTLTLKLESLYHFCYNFIRLPSVRRTL
jgi:hypothetical protein